MPGSSPAGPDAGPGTRAWWWFSLAGVWLLYLLYPVGEFMGRHASGSQTALALLLLALFLTAYVAAWRQPFHLSDLSRLGWAGALAALSVLAAWLLHLPDALGGLVYVSPVLGFGADRRVAVGGTAAGAAVLAGAWRILTPHVPLLLWTLLVPYLAVAVAMQAWVGFWRLGMRLRLAETQLRDLTVANERLALARDLHDVVGHSLSALAVRADLAARQAAAAAPASADEMRRVAQLAREALADVRHMVSQWRAVSLQGEWTQARAILEAAGLHVREEGTQVPLPPELDRGLGFFVREGVTNILRDSAATECRLTLAITADGLVAELCDNGTAPPSGEAGGAGSGLSGLRERFLQLGGRLSNEATPQGFRLAAEVPWHET